MPQIETPPNFDFSYDQHKLLLIEDLKGLSSRLDTLVTQVDEIGSGRSGLRIPAATLVLIAGSYVEGNLVSGGAPFYAAGLSGASLEGPGMFGRHVVQGSVATTIFNGFSQQVVGYTRPGEVLQRHAQSVTPSITFAGSLASVWEIFGQVPRGITNWSPEAIKIDWRHIWPTVAADALINRVQVYVNGTLQVNRIYDAVAVGASYDTGWITTVVTKDELGDYALTPGARIQIRVQGSNVRTGQAQIFMGNVSLNWE